MNVLGGDEGLPPGARLLALTRARRPPRGGAGVGRRRPIGTPMPHLLVPLAGRPAPNCA